MGLPQEPRGARRGTSARLVPPATTAAEGRAHSPVLLTPGPAGWGGWAGRAREARQGEALALGPGWRAACPPPFPARPLMGRLALPRRSLILFAAGGLRLPLASRLQMRYSGTGAITFKAHPRRAG